MRKTILFSVAGFLVGAIVFGAVALRAMSRARKYERQMMHCEMSMLDRRTRARWIEGMAQRAVEGTNVTNAAIALGQIAYRPEQADGARHMSALGDPDKSESIDLYAYETFECIRAHLEREVIAHLRKLTGQDLGSDPNAWLDKYHPTRTSDP